MEGESLGSAVLTLDADQGPLNSALDLMDTVTQGKVTALGDKVKGIFGGKLSAGAALGAGAVVGGLALAGKALYDLGGQFDKAFDTIQTTTGATGQKLEGLKDDFKDVVSSVPTDFESAATAVAQLNQRLGLTGDPLRTVSKQVLELSRLTGTDLNENIEALSRLFGDWGISADQMGPHMDKLYRLSQRTGIGVSDLSRLMVQFGSPLRQLGLDFDTAAVMFAKFEKEGVNIQTLMPGMRMALKNFSDPTDELVGKAKELGISLDDPSVALSGFMKAIQDAPTDLKANQLAFEIFGARAGPDMAAAIREGRFEFDDLMGAMNKGTNTIMSDAEATNDLSENWLIFKNKVLVGLEPLATAVFSGINKGLVWVMNAMEQLSTKGTSANNALRATIEVLGFAFGAMFGVAKAVISALITIWTGAFQVLQGVFNVFKGLFTGNWKLMWSGVKQIFQGIWNLIKGALKLSLGVILAQIRGIMAPVWNIVQNTWNRVRQIIGNVWDGIKNTVRNAVSGVLNILGGAAEAVFNKARNIGEGIIRGIVWVKDKAVDIANSIVRAIGNAISSASGFAAAAANRVIDLLNDAIPNSISVPGPAPNINLPDSPIPHIATGTRYFQGNLALVGERGPELAALPTGTRVSSARETENLMKPNMLVKVFVGDREITDIVRTEVSEGHGRDFRHYKAGRA